MLTCIRTFGRGGGYADMYTVSTLQDREPSQLFYSLSMLCDLMQSVAMGKMEDASHNGVSEHPQNLMSTSSRCKLLLQYKPI